MSAVLQLLLLLFVPTITGLLILRHGLGKAGPTETALGMLPMGLGLGLGLSGLLAFASLVLVDTIVVTWEIGLCLVMVYLTARRKRWRLHRVWREAPTPAARLVVVGSCPLIVAAVVAFIAQARQTPHGGWDAWDFWNMRARFFHRGGVAWADSFSQIISWTHPEYPALMPSMVARGFRLLNDELPLVPMALGFVFTFAAVATLYFGVSSLRGRTQGLLAALVLCCTPYFVFHGTEQYADNPLAFYFLATVVCIGCYDQRRERCGALVLSGLFAGLATFLKNEGIMFLVCLLVARTIWVLRNEGRAEWRKQAWYFSVGALPGVCATIFFKTSYAVMPDYGEFYARQLQGSTYSFMDHLANRATDAARYRGLFGAWGYQLWRFDQWLVPLVVLLPAYGIVMGLSPERPAATVRSMVGLFLLQLIGVSVLFLFWSTLPIFIHMDAVGRLLTQMLPTVLFVVFVAVRTPWEITSHALGAEPQLD